MTTTEPLPARHCIERAVELHGCSPDFLGDVERNPHFHRFIIILARTLEEYGYQPPPPPLDPIRKRAREICAGFYRAFGDTVAAAMCLAGDCDKSITMQATEKALREPGL